ncbi:MAG: HEAT repeat domain-containing protein [Planctomycetaceae bacterium]
MVERGVQWNDARFSPVSKAEHKIYFCYALERASALAKLKDGWFETYGDGLLTLQSEDGGFDNHQGKNAGTSFAILYFMRSTQQILDKQYSGGLMQGGRDLNNLFGEKKKEKKELGPLDALLDQMMKEDLTKLDEVEASAIVEKITFGSKEELVGQKDLLMKMLVHPDAETRQVACWALGRTGDFSLIPEMLKALRDPNVNVNMEALLALRYISRKPNGFGLPIHPLEGADTADEETRVKTANEWRTRAANAWGNWYRQVRPFDEGGGLDELEVLSRGSR